MRPAIKLFAAILPLLPVTALAQFSPFWVGNQLANPQGSAVMGQVDAGILNAQFVVAPSVDAGVILPLAGPNTGEVGDVATPYGAGNFARVDAGTINSQVEKIGSSLVIGGGTSISGSFRATTAATAAPATVGCTTATVAATGVTAATECFCSPSASPETASATEVVNPPICFTTANTFNAVICCATATCTTPPAVTYTCRDANP